MTVYIFYRGLKNTLNMLIVFIKSVITFFLVFLVIRLMGKRQLGEMQPFELVITLIIAEVACIPMNDPYIPFYYGLVPIVTLAFLDIFFSFVARKSIVTRRLLSGKSVIVIDKDGINYDNLIKLNININDLLEAVRSSGYADLNEIEYAILETNGKICVIEKWSDPTVETPVLLPSALLIDGKWNENGLKLAGADKQTLIDMLHQNNIDKLSEVLYMDVRQDGTVYVSPKHKKYFTQKINITGGQNW